MIEHIIMITFIITMIVVILVIIILVTIVIIVRFSQMGNLSSQTHIW